MNLFQNTRPSNICVVLLSVNHLYPRVYMFCLHGQQQRETLLISYMFICHCALT